MSSVVLESFRRSGSGEVFFDAWATYFITSCKVLALGRNEVNWSRAALASAICYFYKAAVLAGEFAPSVSDTKSYLY
jgi:hypothetical protein